MSLDQIDQRVEELIKSGNTLEALSLVEQGIGIRKTVFGLDSDEVKTSYLQLCEMCNSIATEYLERQNFQVALDLLKRAELLCGHNSSAKVKTLNNLACYYRQTGKLRIAQNYLDKALGLQVDMASTHLNMCAVLSQLDKHDKALSHAMQAVILLQAQLITSVRAAEARSEEHAPMLVIAYHNMGVELEHMHRLAEAAEEYQKAEAYATEHLSPTHPLAVNASRAREATLKAVEATKARGEQRKQRQSGKRLVPKSSSGVLAEGDVEIINKAWQSVSGKGEPS